jgi:Na+:H+ antiporter, NhaA family
VLPHKNKTNEYVFHTIEKRNIIMQKSNRLILPVAFIQRSFQAFVQSSMSSGILLLLCTAVALVWANSAWGSVYYYLLATPIHVRFGIVEENFTLLNFINDVVMIVFFFVVGGEIKRELVIGELSDVRKALLPIVAAVFGMAVPGVLFACANIGAPTLRGWAIPSATDIAFSLGVLALLGSRIPTGAKVFLAALAIADDLGAVAVIAIFYSQGIVWSYIGLALPVILILAYCNYRDIQSPVPYTIVGMALWYCVHHSGIHATVAGVVLAFLVPISAPLRREDFIAQTQSIVRNIEQCSAKDESFEQDIVRALETACNRVQPPLMQFLHALEPYNAYMIIPLFALVNAGVVLHGEPFSMLVQPVGLGIVLGLCIGKPIGIMLAVWGMNRMGIALPAGMTWRTMLGVAWLCGIGFTMSLFVGGLSFTDAQILSSVKFSILCGSLLSGLMGYIILRTSHIPETGATSGSGVL